MPKNRIDRINEEIHRELSELLRGMKDPRVRGLVSITRTQTTSDLRYCTVYVSIYEKQNEPEVVKVLNKAAGHLRRELGANLKLRYTPELTFIADDSIRRGAEILGIINSLDIPTDDPEDEDDD